ncbi:MAG: putative oxidoreductase, partial [Gammaproteobacteria bacterium]|nr:putative oxidoreductase [Gammaproteobacteria bacterium]
MDSDFGPRVPEISSLRSLQQAAMLIERGRARRFLYRAAWKEVETQHPIELSHCQWFGGIDTANRRRHYRKAAIGRGVAASFASGLVARNNSLREIKLAFRRAHHRLRYDLQATTQTQGKQSFSSPLESRRPTNDDYTSANRSCSPPIPIGGR